MAVGKGVLVTESVNTLTDDETETFEQLFGRSASSSAWTPRI